ncbi:MAG TPA: S8 family serine peptidase [Steroidobacteraceae bacterium]|nr:S8 family serine peptidase [Steroidobacteraceae bacterium]
MHRLQFLSLCALALLGCAAPAVAQILPPVQLPNLPALPTDELNRTVNGTLRATDPQQLRELRRLRIRELLRTNRTTLEADPRGAPMLRSEVVALSPSQAALDLARAEGFGVGRTRTLEGLDATVVVLQAPAGMSTRRALQRLRQLDPGGTYDFNHVYLRSGAVAEGAVATSTPVAAESLAPLKGARVGLIDGGVQRSHPVFRDVPIHEHGCAGTGVPSEHGTAVASLLVGHAEHFNGVAVGAELYAADVYCGLDTGGAVDEVADAFAWLSRERVPVINISLVGPANGLLEQVIRIVTARGHIVVAAVGNDGPGAPPLYPAAYPAVVAVTAVDSQRRVLIEACRGKHVDFAAPGADMAAAGLDTGFALVRGTSFAAPIAAGLFVRQLTQLDRAHAEAALAALTSQAIDLGARGPDKVYGNGLVGDTLRPPPELAKVSAR